MRLMAKFAVVKNNDTRTTKDLVAEHLENLFSITLEYGAFEYHLGLPRKSGALCSQDELQDLELAIAKTIELFEPRLELHEVNVFYQAKLWHFLVVGRVEGECSEFEFLSEP